MGKMGDKQRDNTQDWVLPAESRPPLLSELVERIDEAVARSRSAEAAAISIGAAALDAADQARRAVDLAERAATALYGPPASIAIRRGTPAPPGESGGARPEADSGRPEADSGSAGSGFAPRKTFAPPAKESLSGFSARADQVMSRLRALEQLPVSA